MNILIIEDEILIQLSLKIFLKKHGHEVTTTTSGVNALALIKTQAFDKVICDLMLSDITGFDVIEDCKTIHDEGWNKSHFIIITAYNNQQILNQAKAYGVPIFIKPFNNLDELLYEINK